MASTRKVEVVYYLSFGGGRLEQPHLLEVPLSSSKKSPLCLRDVKTRLMILRGTAMPSLFSWSYKRGYKHGYVWQDLEGDDDLILPANGRSEYIMKGCTIEAEQYHIIKPTKLISSKEPGAAAEVPCKVVTIKDTPHNKVCHYEAVSDHKSAADACKHATAGSSSSSMSFTSAVSRKSSHNLGVNHEIIEGLEQSYEVTASASLQQQDNVISDKGDYFQAKLLPTLPLVSKNCSEGPSNNQLWESHSTRIPAHKMALLRTTKWVDAPSFLISERYAGVDVATQTHGDDNQDVHLRGKKPLSYAHRCGHYHSQLPGYGSNYTSYRNVLSLHSSTSSPFHYQPVSTSLIAARADASETLRRVHFVSETTKSENELVEVNITGEMSPPYCSTHSSSMESTSNRDVTTRNGHKENGNVNPSLLTYAPVLDNIGSEDVDESVLDPIMLTGDDVAQVQSVKDYKITTVGSAVLHGTTNCCKGSSNCFLQAAVDGKNATDCSYTNHVKLSPANPNKPSKSNYDYLMSMCSGSGRFLHLISCGDGLQVVNAGATCAMHCSVREVEARSATKASNEKAGVVDSPANVYGDATIASASHEAIKPGRLWYLKGWASKKIRTIKSTASKYCLVDEESICDANYGLIEKHLSQSS